MVLSNGFVSPTSSDCSFPSSSFTVAAIRGGSNPYCLASPSPISVFCLRSAIAETIASMTVPSASAWIGSVSFQEAFSSGREAVAKSLPSLETRSSRTFDLSSPSKTLAAFSFRVSSLLTSVFTQKAAPAIAPAATTNASVVTSDLCVCFIFLSNAPACRPSRLATRAKPAPLQCSGLRPPPIAGKARSSPMLRPAASARRGQSPPLLPALAGLPDEQAGEEQAERKHVERHQRHGVLLVGREEEVIRLPAPRADGDLRLLVRNPADGVHRQIAVSGQTVEAVRREGRVAEDHDSRLVLAGPVGGRHGERYGPFQVLARRVRDLAAFLDLVGLAPGPRAGPGELDDRPPRRRGLRLRDAPSEGEDSGQRERRVARRSDRMVGVVLGDGDLRLLRLGVDDLVVSHLRAEQRDHLLEAGADAGIEHGDELPALLDPSLDELDLAVRERRDRSRDDERLRVGRHLLVGGELDLVHLEPFALQALHPQLHAALAGVGDGVLAVALREVDLLRRAAGHLRDGVR